MTVVQGICILGSTGSIGENTLRVIVEHPARFRVVALCAHQSSRRLLEQCKAFSPAYAVLGDPAAARELRSALQHSGLTTIVLEGEQGLCEAVALEEVDKVMSAISGAKGLLPTLAAIKAGKQVLIANKEPLVMAGQYMLEMAAAHQAQIIPVDSEHCGVFQCLPHGYRVGEPISSGVEKIVLTASGGPFLRRSPAELTHVKPDEACNHPNWKMGRKISVDSATLMNKGLEVIEASVLFGLEANKIEVMIHPQSIVHAMVCYEDGAWLAHMGAHDMRIAIAYSLGWPDRIASKAPHLSPAMLSRLEFFPPLPAQFPCLHFAYEALRLGQGAPIVLNAANEVAVHGFLTERVRFMDIPVIIESVLSKLYDLPSGSLEEILLTDQLARQAAQNQIELIQD